MPVIVFSCPFCGEKVETPENNVGREGQCPSCQRIFNIPNPDQAQAARKAAMEAARRQMSGRRAPEYGEGNVVLALIGTGLGLAVLGGSVLLPWVEGGSWAAPAVSEYQLVLLTGSAACLLILLLSVLMRFSSVPALLLTAAWSVTAMMWVGGLWRLLDQEELAEGAGAVSTDVGFYLAVIGAGLAFSAVVFIYFQSKTLPAVPRFGVPLTVLVVLAGVGGFFLVTHQVRPTLRQTAERHVQRERAGRELERTRRENRLLMERLRRRTRRQEENGEDRNRRNDR